VKRICDQHDEDNSSNNKIKKTLGEKLHEQISKPEQYMRVPGIPRIISFAYTDKIAEVKMEYRGDSV